MNTQFTKIAPYNLYPFDNPKDNFDFVCRVLNQNVNPPSLEPKSIRPNNKLILSSNLRRAKECLDASSDAKIIYLPQLSEIKINLNNLCEQKQWEKMGSTIVRQKFKQAFMADELVLSRQQIYQQAKEVFDLIKQEQSVTVISHTFKLILLKAIIETRGQIIRQPELINNYIFDHKSILKFGETFYLDINKSSI